MMLIRKANGGQMIGHLAVLINKCNKCVLNIDYSPLVLFMNGAYLYQQSGLDRDKPKTPDYTIG